MAAEVFRIEIPIVVKDQTEPGVSQSQRKLDSFEKSAKKTQDRIDKMNRGKYQVVIDALDKASSVVGRVSARVKSIAGKTFRFTVKVLDLATRPFRSILSGLNSMLGLIGASLGVSGGIVLPLKLTIQQQNIETAFEVLLGSAQAAKQRVDELTTFAGLTPYTRDEVYEASRVLQVFTGNALSTGDGLRMVGDIAAGTQQPFGEVALWTGRLYDAMASGRPVGEMTSRLQEMGAISGDARDRLEKLADSGLDISKTWPKATEEFARFDGMMEKMSNNLGNLLLGVKSFFMNNVFKRWGEGITNAITPALEAFRQWRKENSEGIAKMGDFIEETGAQFAHFFVDKIQLVAQRINALFDDDNFKNAETAFDKLKIAWDKIIAEPFSEWWNSTGFAWFADKASKIGEGLGIGITMGLLALLGIDISSAVTDGATIGGAFIQGFLKGFDTEKITEALRTWVDNNKEVFAALGIIIGAKIIGGLISWILKISEFKNLFGGGGKSTGAPSSYATDTMYVTAQIVYVYGNSVQSSGGKTPGSGNGGSKSASSPSLPAPSLPSPALPLPVPSLPGTGSTPSLPGPIAKGSGGTASSAGKSYRVEMPTSKGTSIYMGATGSALLAGLANAGYFLGSGASTIGGAAAAGGGAILGGALGLAGLGIGGWNIYQGTKQTNDKDAKEKYWQGGTKIGMVGAGAAAGAAVGSVAPIIGTGIGALVGAGVGGVGAIFGGNAAGSALSESTMIESALDKVKSAGKDLPSWFKSNVWDPLTTDSGTTGSTMASGLSASKNNASSAWGPVSEWFHSNVWGPMAIGSEETGTAMGTGLSSGKDSVSGSWGPMSGWFSGNVWSPLTSGSSSTGSSMGASLNSSRGSVQAGWGSLPGWFSANVWGPLRAGASSALSWVTSMWQKAKSKLANIGNPNNGVNASVWGHAWGGIMTSPHMGIVAEDGAEGIIPLSPSKRTRGLDLWQRTGELLGVKPYEDGGIVGSIPVSAVPLSPGQVSGGNNVDINVNVTLHPEFRIDAGGEGMDEESIFLIIKTRIQELSDDISDDIAEKLARIFANMPVKGGA